jgi:hypothetical protein
MATDKNEVHESAGVPDGHVLPNGEKVVYVYGDDGEFVEWGKEPADGPAADENVRPRNEDQEAAAREELARRAKGEDVEAEDREYAREAVRKGLVTPAPEEDEG